MDKLTAIKIKHPNGTYSDEILLSVLAENVRYNDTKGLIDQLELLQNQINQIARLDEGSTTGDAELKNARIGNDGVTYANAGQAIRANDAKSLNTVLVRSSDPDPNNVIAENKLWINKASIDEVEIPTWEEFSDLKNHLDSFEKHWYAGDIKETGNGFLQLNGTIYSNNTNYKWVKYYPKKSSFLIHVDRITIPAHWSSLGVFGFFRSDNTLIKIISNSEINTGESQTVFNNVEVEIPAGTEYVIICFGDMSSSTYFSTISEFGFFTPDLNEIIVSQPLDGSLLQQFYFHCKTSDLGDYTSLFFNAKIQARFEIQSYDILFTGYNEDYSGRTFTVYKSGLSKNIKNNILQIAENFQDTSKSIKNKYWNGVIVNIKYKNVYSMSSGQYLRTIYQYPIKVQWCILNNISLQLTQYPSAGYFSVFTKYTPPYNPLLGGFLCCIGDSLTAVYYKSEEQSWVSLIAKWNNMRYENHGISGNPLAKISSYTQHKCMAERVDDLDASKYYSHIFVMGGANDYNYSIPIGTNSDTEITTFKGAVKHIITTLTNKFPRAKIVFGTTYRRNQEYLDKPYADAMLEICKIYSIPCLNNYENSGVQFFNEEWMKIYGAINALGNNHLNAAGDLFVAPRFQAALKYGIQ